MITSSSAIVLKRFPYGETSIITRCFVKKMGKVSFIVHGAHSKKSPKSSYFQPINCLDIVFYYKETRTLQTISKSTFVKPWNIIPKDLKKISYAMALIELTDKCLIDNDPHPQLYDDLFIALDTIEKKNEKLNLVFWQYQYSLLSKLGFKPDLAQREVDFSPLPDPFSGPNSKRIFEYFENDNIKNNLNLSVTSADRKAVGNYLNTCLGIHFEGAKNLKSLQILKEIIV